MAEYIVNKGKVVNVTEEEWPTIVSKIEVNDGVLNFINNSDEIKLLEFDEIQAKVMSFGQLNMKGKLIEVYTSNGELGQKFNLPIEGHSIGGIFVETAPDSGIYEYWRCVNFGSMKHEFDEFAKGDMLGNVFKIEDNQILFTDNEDYSNVPLKDCKIAIPNIVVSTKDGDENSKHARFATNTGGSLNFEKITFSNFYGAYTGMSNIAFKDTSFGFPLNITYMNKVTLNNVVVSNNTSYSSGTTVAYCQDVTIDKIVTQSTKSYGLNISYSKDVNIVDATGVLVKRDSNSDASINYYTVQGLECSKVKGVGGMVLLSNINGAKLNKIEAINNIKKQQTSSYSQPNLKIQDSSDITVNEVIVPEGGSSYDSFVNVLNSTSIKVLKLTTQEDYANYALRCDVVYDSKFTNFKFGGTRNSGTIRLDGKSNNVLVQNFVSDEPQTYRLGAKNSTLKGVFASDIKFDDGAFNSIGHQLYSEDNKGIVSMLFTKNTHSKILNGKPKFSYGNSLNIAKDDEVVVKFPFLLRGVKLLEEDPVVQGSDMDDLRIFVKAKTKDVTTDYMLLKKENLSKIQNLIGDTGFELFFKFDGVNLDNYTVAKVQSIQLHTDDSRFDYPVDFKVFNVMLDKMIQTDKKAVFALMYKDTYFDNKTVLVEDKDGYPIYGKIDGRSMLTFEYDYKYNEQANRKKGEPFDAVLVVNSPSFSEPILIESNIDNKVPTVFNIMSVKDKAFELAEFVLNQNSDTEE